MKRKALKIAALLSAAAMLTTGCKSSAGEKNENRLPSASVSELSKKDLSETLEVDGVVESAEKDSAVTTELTEYKISSVKVSVGDKVKSGDVLFEFDSTELQKEIADLEKIVSDSDTLSDYRYKQLEKNLDSVKKSTDLDIQEAEKNLQDLKNERDKQQTEYNNQLANYNNLKNEANDIMSRASSAADETEASVLMTEYQTKLAEASQALGAYESAYAQIQALDKNISMAEKSLESVKIAASDSVDNAKYEIDTYSLTADSSSENTKKLDELKKKLEKTTVKATRDGVVSAIYAEEGKICRDGLLMTLQNSSDMCIHVGLTEENLLSVESGMDASITILARKDDEYKGSVDRVLEIKTANGFDTYINIEDTTNFRIGMTAKVKIKTVDADEAIAVSSKSIFEDEESGKKYVYEAEKQDDESYKLRKVEITEGIVGKTYTEISGEGLDEGDYIVSSPGKFEENDIVRVRVGR